MLPIDLTGKRAFVAGIADDHGYGWAICKALAAAGAEISVGTWPPVLSLLQKSLERDRLDLDLPGGAKMKIAKIYPLDAAFDAPEDVPAELREDKRYKDLSGYTISEAAEAYKQDHGEQSLDVLVHSLANGPEVKKPLLETSRKGYLAALSASAYSLISLVQRFGPLMRPGGAIVSLTYMASERVIPGYGGGMSSAKAALESDTRVLAFEAGRKWNVRVNTVSAGPLPSRAAKAIGTIELLLDYYKKNSALPENNTAADVGHAAAFLCSPLGAGITGTTVYVDKGYHSMGMEPEALAGAQS
ncbi:MAG: enoyl-[acyl-carrier-protein] reductase [Planctomycetota bacterium]|nr:enoyl-[acyl-carrier-protein] reductase [Planctomycetota bacterium]